MSTTKGESGYDLSLPVQCDVESLCGAPAQVANDLRMLAARIERGERFQSLANGCIVTVTGAKYGT